MRSSVVVNRKTTEVFCAKHFYETPKLENLFKMVIKTKLHIQLIL